VAERIRVARIGAAHGVRGEVKLWPFTQDPMAVASYGPLETEDGTRRFEIESLRPAKDFLVARIAGIADRDAAETLTNLDLFVPRERLPAIEEQDTYYHADLIGLAAVTADGNALGTVTAVHNFGAGDIIEIAPVDGGAPLMLSFTEAAVPKVDLKAKRIVVVPPEETVIPAEPTGRRAARPDDKLREGGDE
jgi:16S rRNA processing protein RimM